jgi:adenosyl cobinamide kinase/adenosyl cobinamide phosphate guanylyltransferase
MTRRHSSTDEKGTEELWIYSELDGEAEQWVVFLDDVVSWIGNAAGYEERKAEAKRATKQQLEEQKDAVLAAANGPETWSKEGYQDARWGMPRGEVAKVIPGAGATQYDLSGFDLARTTTFLLDREFERVFVYKAGLLSEVVLHAKQSAPRDGELFQALRAVLAKKYGDPEDSSARAARWKLADTVIHLGFTASAPDAADRVFIRYIAGARVRDEEAREEAKRHALEQQL